MRLARPSTPGLKQVRGRRYERATPGHSTEPDFRVVDELPDAARTMELGIETRLTEEYEMSLDSADRGAGQSF